MAALGLLEPARANQAARRFFEGGERPLFRCAWERAVFLHFEVDPEALRPRVPFPLDLYEGRAYVSLVAFTLRDLRFFRGGPPLATHGFLNVRTYCRGGAITFLAEWLPHRLCVLLGPRLYGLPYRPGRLDYRHVHERGELSGQVRAGEGRLRYRGRVSPDARYRPCEEGSLEEFLLERYVALTRHGAREREFRVWHAPWKAAPVPVDVGDDSLVAATGPWYRRARFLGAHYSPGFEEVWMGRPGRRPT